VRQAFIEAFDRTYIPKLFQSGEAPIASWISPGLLGYNPEIGLKFNLEKARQLLSEAGYPNGKGFPKVELWYANTTPENRQMSEIAQFQWQHNLHVPVELKNVEWKVYLKQLDQDPPQIFRLQWYVDYPDPDSFMNMYTSESGNNHSQWKNKRYDELVKKASIALDPDTRKALYDQAQKLLIEDDAVFMPLYVVPKSYMLKPNVGGFMLDSLNIARLDQVRFK
jgi:oligopeptide transport system substrate-binding protein